MIKYKEQKEVNIVRIAVKFFCDICGKEYKPDDHFEIQEFLHIRRTGGYGSVFGDEERIECDICQHCLKTFIDGKYRIIGDF